MNEPVAWMDKRTNKCVVFINTPPSDDWIPLYTHPVKELTNAEIIDCLTAWAKEKYGDIYLPPSEHQTANAIEMARAVLEYAQKK